MPERKRFFLLMTSLTLAWIKLMEPMGFVEWKNGISDIYEINDLLLQRLRHKNSQIFKQVWVQPKSQPLDLAGEQGSGRGDGSTGDFYDIYKYLQIFTNIYK